jgi:DNA polymerase-3 subunit delta'
VGEGVTLLRAMDGHPLDAARHAAAGMTGQGWAALPAAVSAGRASFFHDWPLALVVESLQKFCHDELAMAVGGAPRYFDAASLHGKAELARLLAWKEELTRVARQVDHPWSEPLLVEALLARAVTAWNAPGLDTLRP